MGQLLVFLTGPAGAGKPTAIKVAQIFYFEFCRYVSDLWSDSTFLFIAYTGSAASLLGVSPYAGMHFYIRTEIFLKMTLNCGRM